MNTINDLKKAILNDLICNDFTHFSIDMCSLLEQVCKEYFLVTGIKIEEESFINKIKKIAKDINMDNVENFLSLIKDRNNLVHQRVNYSSKIDDILAFNIINDYNKLIGKIRYRHRKILSEYKIEIDQLSLTPNHDYTSLSEQITLLKDEIQNLSSQLNNSTLIKNDEKNEQKPNVLVDDKSLSGVPKTSEEDKSTVAQKKETVKATENVLNKKKDTKESSQKNYSPKFIIENGVLIKYNGYDSKVVLPKEVKEIGEGAFYCSFKSYLYNTHTARLQEIDLTGITKIGARAFKGCNKLKTVILSDSLEVICEKAFYECRTLENLVLPKSLTLIEKAAFSRCESLKTIDLPDNLTYLGFDAFCFCSNLEYVSIGKKLYKQIAFSFCNKIKKYEVSSENAKIKSVNGDIYSKDGKTLICHAFGKGEYVIPDHCEIINWRDFNVNKKVDRFIVDKGNKYFTTYKGDLYDRNKETLMFYCAGKTNKAFTIPDFVKYIQPGAFYENEFLEKIIIKNDIFILPSSGKVCLPQHIKEIEIYSNVTDISWLNLCSGETLPNLLFYGDISKWETIKKPDNYNSEKFLDKMLFVE